MTPAKTCHTSNILQDLAKPTHIATKKLSESQCFNCFIFELEEN